MSQSAVLVCSIDLHHGQCAQIDGATVAVCTLLAHFYAVVYDSLCFGVKRAAIESLLPI